MSNHSSPCCGTYSERAMRSVPGGEGSREEFEKSEESFGRAVFPASCSSALGAASSNNGCAKCCPSAWESSGAALVSGGDSVRATRAVCATACGCSLSFACAAARIRSTSCSETTKVLEGTNSSFSPSFCGGWAAACEEYAQRASSSCAVRSKGIEPNDEAGSCACANEAAPGAKTSWCL